ncbi:MAG: hypothetical protein M1465_03240 [Candidatus Marsarchaeota archaeon]|jgi:hypothetical protein|nr:hypothetical protein [Candidatus Marsarchaeota archaeon]
MIKRIVYIGLFLLAISIVAYYSVYSSIMSQTTAGYAQNITRIYDNFTLVNNSVGTFSFMSHVNNASIYVLRASAPVDVFVLNATGYGNWKNFVSNGSSTANDLRIAKSLEGKGAVMLYENVTNATMPVSFVKPIYVQNNSNITFGMLGQGKFYILSTLFPATNNSKATVNSTLAPSIDISQSISDARSLSLVGIAATLMLIVSFVVILIGILRQDKSKQNEELKPEAVEELYKGIRNSSSETQSSKIKETRKTHRPKKR